VKDAGGSGRPRSCSILEVDEKSRIKYIFDIRLELLQAYAGPEVTFLDLNVERRIGATIGDECNRR
jgi:hypothetical protein